MELRSSQQGRQQEDQPEQGVTEATASVNEVEALQRQLETLKASRDAEYRRRREHQGRFGSQHPGSQCLKWTNLMAIPLCQNGGPHLWPTSPYIQSPRPKP